MPAGTISNEHGKHEQHHILRVQAGNSSAALHVFLVLRCAVEVHTDFVTFSQNRLIEFHVLMPPGTSQA